MQAQQLLRDCGLGIPSTDSRRIDLVARGLPLFGGLPIFGDASVVSPLHGDGTLWGQSASTNGVALQRTRARHEGTYQEICISDKAVFLLLGAEVGGRLSHEALRVLGQLAAVKARDAPELLRGHARHLW